LRNFCVTFGVIFPTDYSDDKFPKVVGTFNTRKKLKFKRKNLKFEQDILNCNMDNDERTKEYFRKKNYIPAQFRTPSPRPLNQRINQYENNKNYLIYEKGSELPGHIYCQTRGNFLVEDDKLDLNFGNWKRYFYVNVDQSIKRFLGPVRGIQGMTYENYKKRFKNLHKEYFIEPKKLF